MMFVYVQGSQPELGNRERANFRKFGIGKPQLVLNSKKWIFFDDKDLCLEEIFFAGSTVILEQD